MKRALSTALLLAAVPWSLGAQAAPSPVQTGGSLEVTRPQLQELLTNLETVSQSSAYSGRIKETARRNAELIRERLVEGDFRVGDRIQLIVEGEPDVPDTLAVQPGPQIVLPAFGAISLKGVLRSELEDHLTKELGRYIHNPVVTARANIRLAILGTVGQAGFFVVPADMLIGEALMLAGGPGPNADLEKLRIERGQRTIWEGQPLQEAMIEGTTLDQLNLRAGDQIFLPAEPQRSFMQSVLRYGLLVASVMLLGVSARGIVG